MGQAFMHGDLTGATEAAERANDIIRELRNQGIPDSQILSGISGELFSLADTVATDEQTTKES